MIFINQADETRRQAREGKEKGVPEARQARPPIDGETISYNDVFVDGGSDGNNTSADSGSGDAGGDGETTDTQGAEENTSASGSTGGGITFNPDDPSTWATTEGTSGAHTGDDLENATSTEGETCIGCDVDDLTGITEGNCATGSGDCFTINYDGVFPTPDGWTDPDSPPPLEVWEQGFYFYLYGTDSYDWPTAGRSYSSWEAAYQATRQADTHYGVIEDKWNPTSGHDWVADDDFVWSNYRNGDSLNRYWRVRRYSCTPTEGSLTCPIEVPVQDGVWPADGCYDLIFDGLTFKGHELDPDLPDKYKGDGTSFVEYCTTDGNDGATRTAVDGGFQLDTTNMRRIYDSDGKLIAAGDKTQTFKEQYEP